MQGFGFDHELFSQTRRRKTRFCRNSEENDRRPLVFTASHRNAGLARAARPSRIAQGALLCQDWSGFGRVSADDYLAASDIADDAHVGGMVVFFFACFTAGTPKTDQFS